MPFFSVHVHRSLARGTVEAQAVAVWWGAHGRSERELASVAMDVPPGDASLVLGVVLGALAEELLHGGTDQD